MRYRLAEHGRVFLTRERGERVLAALSAKLEDQQDLVIDFEDVRSVSYSFVDEFVGRLADRVAQRHGEAPEIANVSPQASRAIERSFSVRGLAAPRILTEA